MEAQKNKDKKYDKRHENLIPIKKGERLNPRGRGVGVKDYRTLYREAILKIAKANDKDPIELELEIVSKGLSLARKGDYRFYKDLLDRLHGQATQRKEITGADGNPLEVAIENKTKINKLLKNFIKKNE
jgi:hypothetical protein